MSGERMTAWMRRIRWLAIAIMAISLISILRDLPVETLASGIKAWIGDLGYWGPVAMIGLYVVATILFVPGTLLTLVAGAAFGLGIGMLSVSIGSTLGAAAAFFIARYVARDKVAELASRNRHFNAVDRAIEEGGWRVVGLLRLSPAIPFNLQNYLYGLTAVRFWPYVLTSWIAMLPGTFLYVYIGHLTGAALGQQRQRTSGEWIMLSVGLLSTLAVTLYITRLARSKLRHVETDQLSGAGSDPSQTELQDGSRSLKPSSSLAAGTWRWLAGAAVGIAAAVYVHLQADSLQKWLEAWFAGNPSG